MSCQLLPKLYEILWGFGAAIVVHTLVKGTNDTLESLTTIYSVSQKVCRLELAFMRYHPSEEGHS